MRIPLLAALFAALAAPVLADETSGTVQSWDPAGLRLTLTDKTVWLLPADLVLPAGLTAGDRIAITFRSGGDNGVVGIDALTRSAAPLPEAAKGGT
jgi:hypothetical protein